MFCSEINIRKKIVCVEYPNKVLYERYLGCKYAVGAELRDSAQTIHTLIFVTDFCLFSFCDISPISITIHLGLDSTILFLNLGCLNI